MRIHRVTSLELRSKFELVYLNEGRYVHPKPSASKYSNSILYRFQSFLIIPDGSRIEQIG